MVPFSMVVRDILRHGPPEMPVLSQNSNDQNYAANELTTAGDDTDGTPDDG